MVGYTTTSAINAFQYLRCEFESRSGKMYSIQNYVIKLVSDLRQDCGFHQVHRFPPPIKLTTTV